MTQPERGREESGAVAVLVAILAVVLLGCAGLTVDLGSMFVAHQQAQRLTDRAVLAGAIGQDLPAPAPTGVCPYGASAAATDQAVKDVASYLAAQGNGPVTPEQLVDCNTGNGEVFYGTLTRTTTNSSGWQVSVDPDQLSLVSPTVRVDFSFARVLGEDHGDVTAVATAEVRSPMIAGVPFYAFTGCDYGLQTISQPNDGHAASNLMLASPNDTNAATLTSVSPSSAPLNPPSPPSVTITGSNLSQVSSVGFFESGTSASGPPPVEASPTQTPTATSLNVTVPGAVTGTADYWYIRVKIGAAWSSVYTSNGTLAALPFTVGNPPLMCGQGSSQGNFGTLLIPNSGATSQSDQIALNIASGVQWRLAVYPQAASPWTCGSADPDAVLVADGTNCVDTKTGMDANAAEQGLLSGVGSTPGRLRNLGAGTGCRSDGTPNTTVYGAYTINDDTLSCFFTDDTTNVGQVSSATYSLPSPVISPRIFRSPRFVMVPVLGTQPGAGGSQKYEIVDFRPAFLTDQVNSATRATPPTSTNGITGVDGTINSLRVIFLNSAALPDLEGIPNTTYSGAGPKLLALVN